MGGDHCRAPSPACERMRNVLAALAPLLALCNAQCGAFVSYFECESHGTDAIVAEPLPGTHAECHAFCEGLGLGGCCFVSGESTAPSVCHFQSGNSVAATIDAARLATACATVVNLDCLGSWSACTSACEAAVDRQWIETQAPSGSGVACPESAEACAPGEGECPLVLAVIARFGSRKFNTDRKLTVAADVVEPTARSWAWSWYTLDGAKGGFADAPMLTPHEGSAAGVANLVPLPANINAHLPAVILCHYQNQ